ncbi:carboxypeptidase regulatory-like domain-containing protein [Streptomyces sp. NBC_00841]|uniref:carboxypeptidase regulatory-like domain-containing protein n=1 Tax=unclassified Streptomyces TaxID=2593676 RepID=UPI00225A9387|nr:MULTISPECIES: carboxypeptidase regulatory-like domain-containing protein [unclassified Streptomyces]MCX4530836.1 carboxypeptidase regulatory-like domain-containing protein [Streptomyces sp. NBC_01669]WSA03422.1 carboxypeptidase regulatory-like domain-containing protein [Streptomyces sp. NBC_00841]
MASHGRHIRRLARLVALGVAAVTALAVQLPAQAAPGKTADPSSTRAPSPTASGDHPSHRVCGAPKHAAQMACQALERDDVKVPKAQLASGTDPAGFGPAALQSAYNLPSSSGGAGQTVAIVDAFDNPNAEAELAVYRQQYGIPPCTTANGCFKKVDQRGGTSYPAADSGWSAEIALDLDMVSASCPNCHILLVEADDNSVGNLGAAVNKAVALGAKFVSNSYGANESPDELTDDAQYFNHPGVAITASSGDSGYGVSYPAASPYVTAVGGTSLVKDSSTRGWSETVWNGAGSGCSAYEAKPSVQSDTGCARRTVADVSAVADPNTGVAVYVAGAWHVYGGTSVSAPIIASVYALGGTPAPGTLPNAFPYAKPSALNDVTSGSNGACGGSYLCSGRSGYDGPTGLGTPNGVAAFATGPHAVVGGTVTDSAGGAPIAGARISAGDQSTTTDAAGHYQFSVRPGTYDIQVLKFGYVSKTFPAVTLADSQSVIENASLTAKARVKVTGRVRDASGHGWPLYAAVQVKGEPTSTVHTDPATGRYSINLPTDDSYTLQVDAVYPGYQQTGQDVTVAESDLSQDFGVKVDAASCDAAGYTVRYDGDTESFEGASDATPPAGWTVVDNKGNGQTWRFVTSDPATGAAGNHTGGAGQFAIIDSYKYGTAGSQDTSLVSPVWDFSNLTTPYLSYHNDYHGKYGSADVDLSVDGGTTWQNLTHWTSENRYGPRTERVDLPAAAGKSTVQIRFHYSSSFSYWWAIDDVFAGQRTCAPTPGGLVTGQVTDKNTGEGVAGAKVVSTDKPADGATTVATSDDPALDDGFYWFFSSLTGSHQVAISAPEYTSATATVDIAADRASTADAVLAAGRLQFTPTSIAKTLGWQGTGTARVTVTNTGSASAHVKLTEQDGGFRIQGQSPGAALQEIPGTYEAGFIPADRLGSPETPPANPASPPWTTVANYPIAVQDNAVATADDGKVYSVGGASRTAYQSKGYVYNPETTSWSPIADSGTPREAPQAAFLDGKLYVTGGWSPSGATLTSTQIYDPASDSWTTGASTPKGFAGAASAVLNGKWYLIGGCTGNCGATDVQVYDPASDSWTTAADYPEATSWEGCGAIDDVLYCAGGLSTTSTKHAYAYNPDDDSWSHIPDMPIDLWGMGATAASGQLLLSGGITNGTSTLTNRGIAYSPATGTWTDLPNSNSTTYRGGSACGFYKVGGSNGAGFNPANSVELLPGYGECASTSEASWLSEDITDLTLAPGDSAEVTLTMDASAAAVNQPGTYAAKLGVSEHTPYRYAPITAAMTVSPPKNWGKITGTVTGAGCTGSPTALQGATVRIDGGSQSFTLTTDKNGHYALWLDAHSNSLSLIAAKDGWTPQGRTVKITKGVTTTADFTLTPARGCT